MPILRKVWKSFKSHVEHFLSPTPPPPQKKKKKKNRKRLSRKKFVIFREMEHSCSHIKKILIFSQRRLCLIFKRNFFYISEKETMPKKLKHPLRNKVPYISGNGTQLFSAQA